MTTFEDVGELYIKYQNDNGKQSEVDFYKNQLQKSIEEMDNLRQVSVYNSDFKTRCHEYSLGVLVENHWYIICNNINT